MTYTPLCYALYAPSVTIQVSQLQLQLRITVPFPHEQHGTGCAPLLQCLGRLSLPLSVGR